MLCVPVAANAVAPHDLPNLVSSVLLTLERASSLLRDCGTAYI